MKKDNKKIDDNLLKARNVVTDNVFKVFLGGVIFGGTSVAGISYYYSANEISYESSEQDWKVENVKEALDTLYDEAYNQVNVVYLGNGTTYNLKTDYEKYGLDPDDYKKLTNDNFITGINSGSVTATGGCSAWGYDKQWSYTGNNHWANRYLGCDCSGTSVTKNFSVVHSYNNETGILLLTLVGGISNPSMYAYIIGNI